MKVEGGFPDSSPRNRVNGKDRDGEKRRKKQGQKLCSVLTFVKNVDLDGMHVLTHTVQYIK